MDDWKQKADTIARKKAEKQNEAYQRKLETHQSKFSCRVCGKPSTGPGSDNDGYTNWESPTGLHLCSSCVQYVCGDHIHQGICKLCATDWLAGKSYHERKAIKGWLWIGPLLGLGLLCLFSGSYFGAAIFLFIGGCAAIINYIDNVA